jgi:N-acetylglucosaminyl-diphospho-decaprenol L-rhamnosyltransferase
MLGRVLAGWHDRGVPADRSPLRVVIVNFHSEHDVEERLRSGILIPDDEVLIVDNASDPERVGEWGPRFGVVPVLLPANVGFAAAVNAAVARSVTRHPVLLLNPDLSLAADTLAGLIEALAAEDPAGPDGVAPLLVEPPGRLQVGAGGGPVTLGSVAGYFLFASHVVPSLRGVFLTRRQLVRGVRVDWLCMACLLLRGDCFERFGTVPEAEVVYAEDVDWGTAATARGARFRLVPALSAAHARGGSGGSAAWTGAFERMLRRRLPGVRGAVAVGCVRVGLGVRRAIGRRVT